MLFLLGNKIAQQSKVHQSAAIKYARLVAILKGAGRSHGHSIWRYTSSYLLVGLPFALNSSWIHTLAQSFSSH